MQMEAVATFLVILRAHADIFFILEVKILGLIEFLPNFVDY